MKLLVVFLDVLHSLTCLLIAFVVLKAPREKKAAEAK